MKHLSKPKVRFYEKIKNIAAHVLCNLSISHNNIYEEYYVSFKRDIYTLNGLFVHYGLSAKSIHVSNITPP